jgi:hypothetical protein
LRVANRLGEKLKVGGAILIDDPLGDTALDAGDGQSQPLAQPLLLNLVYA